MARKNAKNIAKSAAKAATPVSQPPPAPVASTKPPSTWWEENWTSWLRPVVFLGLAGIFLLLYSSGVIPDFWAAMVILFVLVGVIWFAAISVETKRFPEERRGVFFVLSALVALFVWVPVLFAIFPGQPRLLGDLKKKGDAIDLAPLDETARYLIVAGGNFFGETDGNRVVDYTLEGSDGAKKVLFRGKIEQRLEQTKSRQGVAGQIMKIHTQDKATLKLDPAKPLTLLTELNEQALPDGVHVAIYDPPMGGSWLLLVGFLFYVVLLAIDLRDIANKGKGYLAAGGGVILFGALIFCTNSTPYTPFTTNSDLAQTALGAAMIGGILGAFGGMLLQLILSRFIKRPAHPDEFAAQRVSSEQ